MKGIYHILKANINRNIEPNSIKMTLITSTMRRKTNDALRKQQSMPNDAALYINGIGNGFIAFTWTIWRFLRAYAGLLVDGFDDSGVCLSRGLDQKTVWMACAFQAHRHASPSDLDLYAFWRCWGRLWLWRQWLPPFFDSKRKHEKGRRDLNRKACQYLAIAKRKTNDEDPVGLACGANQDCTHERNLVLGANALRFSWPSYTAVVCTIGYLRFSFWEGKTRCAFDCNT